MSSVLTRISRHLGTYQQFSGLDPPGGANNLEPVPALDYLNSSQWFRALLAKLLRGTYR